jgi:hypothetical protein
MTSARDAFPPRLLELHLQCVDGAERETLPRDERKARNKR